MVICIKCNRKVISLHTERSVCISCMETKDFIIEKAYKLFLNNSYDSVSVTDICNAIEMSKGALYHHFANKNELFKAVIDSHISKMKVRNDFSTLQEYLEYKIETATKLIERVSEHEFLPLNYISLIIDAMRNYPDIQDIKEQLFYFEMEEVKLILNAAIVSGEIRSDINVEPTAQNLMTLTLGVAANLLRKTSKELSIEAFRNQLFEYYNMLKPIV
jgi:AcrR family transcriptional regulator